MATSAKYQGWIMSGIFNGLQKLSIPVFGVISTMLLAKRALTKDEMGVWALFLILTSFVELIRQALVKTSLIKYVNHTQRNEHPKVLSAAFALNVIVSFALIAILACTAGWLESTLHADGFAEMIYIFLIGIVLLIPFSHFEWILYGHSKFKALFWVFFWRQGITLLLLVVALMINGKISLNELVIYFLIGLVVGAIIGYRFAKPHLTNRYILTKEWMSKLWHFGKYVFGSGVSTLVFANAGGMMLSPLLGSTVYTASQSIAARVLNLADMPSQVLSDILFPKSASHEVSNNKARIKYYYEKTVGATICLALPFLLFIVLFPKFVIRILADEQYYDAAFFLQVTAISVLFLAFLKQWAVIIDSTGKPKLNFILISIMAIVNVALSYVMIQEWGFMGAAYALIATHVVGFIITQILLRKFYNISLLMCFVYAFRFYPEIFQIVKEKFLPKWKPQVSKEEI